MTSPSTTKRRRQAKADYWSRNTLPLLIFAGAGTLTTRSPPGYGMPEVAKGEPGSRTMAGDRTSAASLFNRAAECIFGYAAEAVLGRMAATGRL